MLNVNVQRQNDDFIPPITIEDSDIMAMTAARIKTIRIALSLTIACLSCFFKAPIIEWVKPKKSIA